MKSIICVPMGDAAGVGPEILAASVTDPVVRDKAIVVAVGDEEVLVRAARIMNVRITINRVDESLSGLKENALNLLNMNTINVNNLIYGKVNAMCGQAAFECIKKSVELAVAGKVNALATTPINKESLNAAGVPFIGHTEILSDLTKSYDPLTMFQVQELRTFFLTRHMPLEDACKAVKRDRILKYIRRCIEAMRRLGLDNPSLVVAGLNPHCGEHGLFGHEEDNEIRPAIEDANKEGLRVYGPKPADSVFHFALKGAWDAVLSLYHDQGHIATKMVDFERTISLTLGLPFLRTSVDHGTAFDIAGKGTVSALSMVEAIRLAALYAPHFREALD